MPTLIVLALLLILLLSLLRLNPHASSAPAGLYFAWPSSSVERGDWVAVCLPEELGVLSRARGYLKPGDCPGKAQRVGKRIAALAGDTVTVTEAGMLVNGRSLPHTARLSHDSQDRPIPSITPGTYRVPPGHAWLVSNFSPRSWDSRYFGAVPLPLRPLKLTPLLLFSSTGSSSPDKETPR